MKLTKSSPVNENNTKFLWGCFLAIVVVWFSAIFWVPKVSSLLITSAVECQVSLPDGRPTPECVNVLGSYGATGDLFGAVTSLFSALGLFAVAFTVHVESKARKSELKPFVISNLGEDGITLQDPNLGTEQNIDVLVPLVFKNVGEVAINVNISAELEYAGKKFQIDEVSLESPLVAEFDVHEIVRGTLKADAFKTVLGALEDEAETKTNGSNSAPSAIPVSLKINIFYESLSGVTWVTTVKYNITLTTPAHRDKLISLTKLTADRTTMWANKVSVPLTAKVAKGSWDYGLKESK
ncbi:hypothetical protein LQ564_13395 [Massilia sp. G4R7]|uniref:Uncharacterized protein n=1 Tax=Massilia phyllostachyos TaxID=2898585 RepID=A0ABS8Q6D6_9BURK|nr:hypothetical protein [Massilia phyllostachyos]MCD2517303.1 hypothetical protein [Massilia phyllostachyos]